MSGVFSLSACAAASPAGWPATMARVASKASSTCSPEKLTEAGSQVLAGAVEGDRQLAVRPA
jgi:hypothetical protein